MRNNCCPTKQRKARSKIGTEPQAMAKWSLLKVINDAMSPIGDYSPSTIFNYRKSIRTFQTFIGFEQSPVNVTEAKFAAYEKWLTRKGYKPSVVAWNLDCLAAVARFADRSILPDRQIEERRPFADAHIKGTVEYFIVNEYFPVNSDIESRETRRQYAMAVARLSRFIGHPAKLADLTDLTVSNWMYAMREEQLRLKSINNYMNYIRAFWNWAARRGIVKNGPTIKNMRLTGEVEMAKPAKKAEVKSPRKPPVIMAGRAEAKGHRDLLSPNGILKFTERYCSNREISKAYAYRLRATIIRLAKFAGKARIDSVLSEESVNAFLSSIKASPYTVRSYRSEILAIWNAAADEDRVPYPMLRRIYKPKCHELVIECYTLNEVNSLVRAASKLKGEYPTGVERRAYWDAIIRVAWDTGLRRGDLISFERRNVRPDGLLRVVQHKTRQIVTVRLRPETIKAVKAIHRDQPFEWSTHLAYFSRHFKQIVRAARLKRGSFKWLRRASGTYVEMAQIGAGSKHLGHKCPQVFDKHYDGKLGGHTLPQPPELD